MQPDQKFHFELNKNYLEHLKKFYENVIKKFVTKLYEFAKEGVTKFLEALGLEVDGDLSMKTPSW